MKSWTWKRALKVAPAAETIHSKLNFMGELNVHKSFLLLSADTTKIANMHGR